MSQVDYFSLRLGVNLRKKFSWWRHPIHRLRIEIWLWRCTRIIKRKMKSNGGADDE